MYQAIVEAVSELFESVIICASCSFFTDSISDGCTIQLRSNQYKFVFNMSRQTSHESSLLECFSVPLPGVYSVSVCDIFFGQVKTHISRYLTLPNITIAGIWYYVFCKSGLVHTFYHTHSLQSPHSVMQLLKQYLLVQDMEYVHRVCLLITPEVLAVLWNYIMIKTNLFLTCHVKTVMN